jgi:SEC-C motif-containing protein
MNCPCGSGLDYNGCCEPIIKGKLEAETPEKLMRARYSAYVTKEIDFILNSVVPNKSGEENRGEIEEWANNASWEKLEILNCDGGNQEDESGKVEFKAYYISGELSHIHHELGEFKKIDGKWYFDDGKIVKEYPSVKVNRKVDRNSPCPCGSGKKYKKCCGR